MIDGLGHFLDVLLKEGRRKAVIAFGAECLLTGMAIVLHATFDQYMTGLLIVLGVAVGTHVTQTLVQAKIDAGKPAP